ncbi:hypothetical protein ACNFR7_20745 [Streptomyces sp. RM1]
MLGEGVLHLVEAASEIEWDKPFFLRPLGTVWSLFLPHSRGEVPGLGDDAPQSCLLLALHRFVTGTLAALGRCAGVRRGARLPERTCRLPATALGPITTVLARSSPPQPPVLMAALRP